MKLDSSCFKVAWSECLWVPLCKKQHNKSPTTSVKVSAFFVLIFASVKWKTQIKKKKKCDFKDNKHNKKRSWCRSTTWNQPWQFSIWLLLELLWILLLLFGCLTRPFQALKEKHSKRKYEANWFCLAICYIVVMISYQRYVTADLWVLYYTRLLEMSKFLKFSELFLVCF